MTTSNKNTFSHCKGCDFLKDGSCKGDTVGVWVDEINYNNDVYLIDPRMVYRSTYGLWQ